MVVARHIAVAEEGCNPVFGGAHIGLSKNTRAYDMGSKVQHDQQPGGMERDTRC